MCSVRLLLLSQCHEGSLLLLLALAAAAAAQCEPPASHLAARRVRLRKHVLGDLVNVFPGHTPPASYAKTPPAQMLLSSLVSYTGHPNAQSPHLEVSLSTEIGVGYATRPLRRWLCPCARRRLCDGSLAFLLAGCGTRLQAVSVLTRIMLWYISMCCRL